MEIKNNDIKPSYLWSIIHNEGTQDTDKLSVSIKDLKSFALECTKENTYLLRPYYISVKEAARYLSVNPMTIYRRIKEGSIHARKCGSKWLIREVDITDFWKG